MKRNEEKNHFHWIDQNNRKRRGHIKHNLMSRMYKCIINRLRALFAYFGHRVIVYRLICFGVDAKKKNINKNNNPESTDRNQTKYGIRIILCQRMFFFRPSVDVFCHLSTVNYGEHRTHFGILLFYHICYYRYSIVSCNRSVLNRFNFSNGFFQWN